MVGFPHSPHAPPPPEEGRRSDDHLLVALDSATGTPRWSLERPYTIKDVALLPAGGRPHILLNDGHLDGWNCLDPATGQSQWTTAFLREVHPNPPFDGRVRLNSRNRYPISDGGTWFYLSSEGDRGSGIACLDATTGKLVWWHKLWFSGLRRDLLIENHRLYYQDLEGRLVALNAETGDELWQSPEPLPTVSQALALRDRLVVLCRDDDTGEYGDLYCFWTGEDVTAFSPKEWRWLSALPTAGEP